MTILKRLRRRPPPESRDVREAQASLAGRHELPTDQYDRLDDKVVINQLAQFTQVELAAIEAHERTHQNRPAVLAKLRWLRGSEPLTGYDALSVEQISGALSDADTRTLKAVREYERKFRRRQTVLDEVARLLPTSLLSVGEQRTDEQRAARIRDGLAGREKTLSGSAPPSSAADGPVCRDGADG